MAFTGMMVGAGTAAAAPVPPAMPEMPMAPRSVAYAGEYAYAEHVEEESLLNLNNPISPVNGLVTVQGKKKGSASGSGSAKIASTR
jgi:hypothetical protein